MDVREHFPALKSGFIFADSAGGSQTLGDVANRIYEYLLNTNVQTGADYVVGQASTRRINTEAPAVTATFMNASSPNEIVWAPSTTAAFENAARALEPGLSQGDEVIITAEHEANVGPWVRVSQRQGLVLKRWDSKPVDDENPFSHSHSVKDLLPLITSKTRIIAITATSNILGEVIDIPLVVKTIRADAEAKGAGHVIIVVDGVAFAPHRRIDVQAFDADFVAFSYYKLRWLPLKVYGPHMTAMWVRESVLRKLPSLAHYFIDPEDSSHYSPGIRLQPGSTSHELVYATTGVAPYIASLAPPLNSSELESETAKIDRGYDAIKVQEQKLLEPLISYLKSKHNVGVRIVGLAVDDATIRVPTISFVVVGPDGRTIKHKSKDVVGKVDQLGTIGIRYGHFYAHRLLTALGLDPEDGVVRISLVHYHTGKDVEAIIRALDPILQ